MAGDGGRDLEWWFHRRAGEAEGQCRREIAVRRILRSFDHGWRQGNVRKVPVVDGFLGRAIDEVGEVGANRSGIGH